MAINSVDVKRLSNMNNIYDVEDDERNEDESQESDEKSLTDTSNLLLGFQWFLGQELMPTPESAHISIMSFGVLTGRDHSDGQVRKNTKKDL